MANSSWLTKNEGAIRRITKEHSVTSMYRAKNRAHGLALSNGGTGVFESCCGSEDSGS